MSEPGEAGEHPAVWAVIERYLRGQLKARDAEWAERGVDVRSAGGPQTPAELAMCARYARELLTDAMHAAHLGAVGRLNLPPGS